MEGIAAVLEDTLYCQGMLWSVFLSMSRPSRDAAAATPTPRLPFSRLADSEPSSQLPCTPNLSCLFFFSTSQDRARVYVEADRIKRRARCASSSNSTPRAPAGQSRLHACTGGACV
ncbi:hypothetical protein MTO96_000252 [Rhipicephalus appendiculatus]